MSRRLRLHSNWIRKSLGKSLLESIDLCWITASRSAASASATNHPIGWSVRLIYSDAMGKCAPSEFMNSTIAPRLPARPFDSPAAWQPFAKLDHFEAGPFSNPAVWKSNRFAIESSCSRTILQPDRLVVGPFFSSAVWQSVRLPDRFGIRPSSCDRLTGHRDCHR